MKLLRKHGDACWAGHLARAVFEVNTPHCLQSRDHGSRDVDAGCLGMGGSLASVGHEGKWLLASPAVRNGVNARLRGQEQQNASAAVISSVPVKEGRLLAPCLPVLI